MRDGALHARRGAHPVADEGVGGAPPHPQQHGGGAEKNGNASLKHPEQARRGQQADKS